MGGRDRGAIAKGLERLLTRGVEPDGDGDLLERFRRERDQDAFEALVVRHGPMVRGVCRRLLRDPADADDAFQATFLVLARKGASLRDPDRLGPWLHGVAARVAAKARARSARRRPRSLVDDAPARHDDRAEWSDVMAIIDAEMARLPTSQRDVLVACLLNGSSEQEAARAFDCPVGTIKSRLSRAREALRSRLVRRGIAPASASAAVAASSPGSFASTVSAPLLRATLAMVAAPAAVPPPVAALTSGVASTMLAKILATTVAVACGAAAVGLASTVWTADPPPAPQAAPPAKAEAPAPPQDRKQLDRNIRTILLALHNYHAAHDAFPPPAVRAADGRALLSWRVSILPYMDQKGLYDQFHLDEPWDGPHNRKLIDKMPATFQTPGFLTPVGKTRFRGITAPGAMFGPRDDRPGAAAGRMGMSAALTKEENADDDRATEAFKVEARAGDEEAETPTTKAGPGDDRGVSVADVTDGTSNTVFLVVAEDGAEWTRPGEMEVPGGLKMGAVLPALAEDADGYILGMVDGSVQRLPNRPGRRENVLPALLTIAGGEILSSDVFAPPPAAAEPKAPADVEGRLRRVEEKLDAILKRLDALAPPRP